ncbi:MAG: hypothetical protein K5697_00760 [Lachnospiraceae bacterium]|nr:hypothetical protein [Lachnospiraceae bacterium]
MIKKMIVSAAALVTLSLVLLSNGGSIKTAPGQSTVGTVSSLVSPVPASALRPVIIKTLGNHTYYSDEVIQNRSDDRATQQYILNCLKEADKSLNEDIYVFGIGESETRGEYRFWGNKYVNGIVVDESYMGAAYDSFNGYVWGRLDYTKTYPSPMAKGVVPPRDIIDDVYAAADANKDQMFFGKPEPISGTYMLKADLGGSLYYEFTINEFSRVRVDALNGDIIMEHYWDGVYVD